MIVEAETPILAMRPLFETIHSEGFMRGLFKNKISLVLALAGTSLGAASQAGQPPMYLGFNSADLGLGCAGYDAARNTLVVDRCDAATTSFNSTPLNFLSDQTIRSVQTGQCLTRQPEIYTALSFQPCTPGLDTQRFAFITRMLGSGGPWQMLVPVTGPGAGTPVTDTCLVSTMSRPITVSGRFGVRVWSCADWEFGPNKVATLRFPSLGGLAGVGAITD